MLGAVAIMMLAAALPAPLGRAEGLVLAQAGADRGRHHHDHQDGDEEGLPDPTADGQFADAPAHHGRPAAEVERALDADLAGYVQQFLTACLTVPQATAAGAARLNRLGL